MTSAAPAHALLSAAHSLLLSAIHHGRDSRTDKVEHSKTIDKIAPRLIKLQKDEKVCVLPATTNKTQKDISNKLQTDEKVCVLPSATNNTQKDVSDKLQTDEKVCVLPATTNNTQKDISDKLQTDEKVCVLPSATNNTQKDVHSSLLPIELDMFTEDVTDLKEVVDAINRLCDTMKNSDYAAEDTTLRTEAELREPCSDTVDLVSDYSNDQDTYTYSINEDRNESVYSEIGITASHSVVVNQSELVSTEWQETVSTTTYRLPGEEEHVNMTSECLQNEVKQVNLASESLPNQVNMPSELLPNQMEEVNMASEFLPNQWEQVNMASEFHPNSIDKLNMASECLPREVEQVMGAECVQSQADEVTSDGEPALNWEGAGSELYYTASSEVSLVSDPDIPEKPIEMDDSIYVAENSLMSASMQERDEDCVVAGHVAAMRERFESLTRSTTPCLDSRTVSPTLTSDKTVESIFTS